MSSHYINDMLHVCYCAVKCYDISISSINILYTVVIVKFLLLQNLFVLLFKRFILFPFVIFFLSPSFILSSLCPFSHFPCVFALGLPEKLKLFTAKM